MSISLVHDGEIIVATGRHRKDTNWQSKKSSWLKLVEKLSKTHRTPETFNQYIAAPPARQAEIKDIGGFVGGHIEGGNRTKNAIMCRQLITLDIDHASQNIWPDFTFLYGIAAACYSTHKHCNTAPRLRLVLPLDREVSPTEYVAIARRVAGDLNIENFDDTTFEPSRLMYWPSTPIDAEFFFAYQDGTWINADNVLNSYRNWKDASEWPVSERQGQVLLHAMKSQMDPLDKPGIVGAFCRTYSIEAAIDMFLSDAYTQTDEDGGDRYTYRHGTTASGLKTYQDKFAYSYHGTDPISGKLCNAFDLVRIHLFGIQDEGSKGSGKNLPSFKMMTDFCMKDGDVRQTVGREKWNEAGMAFDNAPYEEVAIETETPVPYDDSWRRELKMDKQGNYLASINNVCLILENDPNLEGCFAYDVFRRMSAVVRDLPWRKIDRPGIGNYPYVIETDEKNLLKYIEKAYSISGRNNIMDAFSTHIDANSFHPVRDYLASVKGKWDGMVRLDTLLVDYLGAEDCDYTRGVTRKTLVAAVARIFEPGCKFDYMLTTVGPEGIGKSKLFNKLAGSWFSDSFSFSLLSKGNAAYEAMQGAWLIESAELTGLKKAEGQAVKQFITKEEDTFRAAYGHYIVTTKRQCIFVASSNDFMFLRGDNGGNRRFWPVPTLVNPVTHDVYADLTAETRDQIWAEAVYHYDNGETLFPDRKLKALALDMQLRHTEQDERVGIIHKYLETEFPKTWDTWGIHEKRAFLEGNTQDELIADLGPFAVKDKVCASEIWEEALYGNKKDATTYNIRFIHDILQSIEGWQAYKSRTTFPGYGSQKGYFRIGDFKQILKEEESFL